MRYLFQCEACSSQRELHFPMAELPSSVPCDCGGTSTQIITGGMMSFVRDRDWVCNSPVFPGRWENGVRAEDRQRQIKQNHERMKAEALESKARGGDKDVRHVASIPAEIYAARATEDPSYWETDLMAKCKKDGLTFGND